MPFPSLGMLFFLFRSSIYKGNQWDCTSFINTVAQDILFYSSLFTVAYNINSLLNFSTTYYLAHVHVFKMLLFHKSIFCLPNWVASSSREKSGFIHHLSPPQSQTEFCTHRRCSVNIFMDNLWVVVSQSLLKKQSVIFWFAFIFFISLEWNYWCSLKAKMWTQFLWGLPWAYITYIYVCGLFAFNTKEEAHKGLWLLCYEF